MGLVIGFLDEGFNGNGGFDLFLDLVVYEGGDFWTDTVVGAGEDEDFFAGAENFVVDELDGVDAFYGSDAGLVGGEAEAGEENGENGVDAGAGFS